MPGCKYDLLRRICNLDRLTLAIRSREIQRLDGQDTFRIADYVSHPGAEVVLATFGDDAVADVLDNFRETVGAYVRVGIDKDLRIGSEVDELLQDFADVSPFGRAGEELSVGEGSCTALSIAVVGIRIEDPLTAESGDVELPVVDVLSPFQDYRLETEGQKLQ